jgi:hypothetical protein
MALDIWNEKGTPLDKQHTFTWRDLVRRPLSKLDDDAFSRVRVILMNGIETEATLFSHNCARLNAALRRRLAEVRRIERLQQTLVNWMLPPDLSPIETTIGYEQVAIEVTAHVAQKEPDPYLAQVYRFGLLEDFDHLYRFSALLDRVEGKDAENILQMYTDVLPGRPTSVEHRHPKDDLRRPYLSREANPLSKLHAYTIMSAEQQTMSYYMNIGPLFSDPVARALYAEISMIEEQHTTQYESIIDPTETWLEKWLLHEATEVYNYWSCLGQESNEQLKQVWERFLSYELGHLHVVADLLRTVEHRDPQELLPRELPDPIRFESQRDFVRQTLEREVDLRAVDTEFVSIADEQRDGASVAWRAQLNHDGSPSDTVAASWVWQPGGELFAQGRALASTEVIQ